METLKLVLRSALVLVVVVLLTVLLRPYFMAILIGTYAVGTAFLVLTLAWVAVSKLRG